MRLRRETFVGGAGIMMSALPTLVPGLTERRFARQVEQEHFQDHSEENTDGILFEPGHAKYSVEGGWGGEKTGGSGRIAGSLIALAGMGAAAFF